MFSIDQKTRKLIEKLIEKRSISVPSLLNLLSINLDQLEYSLDKLNGHLEEVNKTIIYINSDKIIISEEVYKFLIDFYMSETFYESYVLEPSERHKYICLKLFFYNNSYLSATHFTESLYVGKTTFMNDLKQVEKIIQYENFEINYSRKKGYQFVGNEEEIRYFIMQLFLKDINIENDYFFYDYFIFNENIGSKDACLKIITNAFNKYSLNLIENRKIEFCYLLLLFKPRLNENADLFFSTYNYSTILKMKEYEVASEILMTLDIDNETSNLYVCGWILGFALGNINEDSPDRSIIEELVSRIITKFELLAGIKFNNLSDVKGQIYSHFKPAYYRMFFNLPIINSLNIKIKTEYKELFHIVSETLNPISNLFHTTIPEDEVSFLTLHFASLITENTEIKIRQKVAIIVCPNGIGSSLISYNELKKIFPEFILLGPIETSEIINVSRHFDYIFTTVPNLHLYTFNKPVFVINPIMTNEEKLELISMVKNETNGINNINMIELVDIIKKNANIKDEDRLIKSISNYIMGLGSSTNTIKSELVNQNIGLTDILKEEYILLNIDSNNWEEAFYIAATPLLDDDTITRNYIETIISNIRNDVTSIHIMDDVALPHAKPNEGANKIGIGITALSKPINMPGNKKVSIIFTLSAVDNNTHIKAMSELVYLLENGDFLELIETVDSPHILMQWIRKFLNQIK
ncbi:BglG family transcription antiterminator [Macrococcus sp. EM39E]|uniref:BglG family transcription antiterminator n=1 Tax=Macrococcus animalis TaxID=3395467 RepID=UPI0039BE27B9